MNQAKPFWQSKTIWVSGIAFVALVLQTQYGFVVSPEMQVTALIGVQTLLRMITKDAVTIS